MTSHGYSDLTHSWHLFCPHYSSLFLFLIQIEEVSACLILGVEFSVKRLWPFSDCDALTLTTKLWPLGACIPAVCKINNTQMNYFGKSMWHFCRVWRHQWHPPLDSAAGAKKKKKDDDFSFLCALLASPRSFPGTVQHQPLHSSNV